MIGGVTLEGASGGPLCLACRTPSPCRRGPHPNYVHTHYSRLPSTSTPHFCLFRHIDCDPTFCPIPGNPCTPLERHEKTFCFRGVMTSVNTLVCSWLFNPTWIYRLCPFPFQRLICRHEHILYIYIIMDKSRKTVWVRLVWRFGALCFHLLATICQYNQQLLLLLQAFYIFIYRGSNLC